MARVAHVLHCRLCHRRPTDALVDARQRCPYTRIHRVGIWLGSWRREHYLVLAEEYRRVHTAVDYRAALENRQVSGLAETLIFLSAVHALFHRSKPGEAGALGLGQRQDPLLLVDCFGAHRRVAAGASLGWDRSAARRCG